MTRGSDTPGSRCRRAVRSSSPRRAAAARGRPRTSRPRSCTTAPSGEYSAHRSGGGVEARLHLGRPDPATVFAEPRDRQRRRRLEHVERAGRRRVEHERHPAGRPRSVTPISPRPRSSSVSASHRHTSHTSPSAAVIRASTVVKPSGSVPGTERCRSLPVPGTVDAIRRRRVAWRTGTATTDQPSFAGSGFDRHRHGRGR